MHSISYIYNFDAGKIFNFAAEKQSFSCSKNFVFACFDFQTPKLAVLIVIQNQDIDF